MITIRFTYYEIMDSNFTRVVAEIFEDGEPAGFYSNLSAEEVRSRGKQVYSNQTEEFSVPTLEIARQMLGSAGYSKMQSESCLLSVVDRAPPE